MNSTKKSNEQIRDAVGKSFLRVVKNHNLYHTFIKGFRDLGSRGSSDRNPFGKFSNFDELMVGVERCVDNGGGMSHPPIANLYDKIGAMINNLLHFFLERNGVDSRHMGMYGQEIFDLSCYKVFGEQYYEEMDSLNHSAPKPTNDFEAFLVSQFMEYHRKMPSLTWEQFYNTIASKIDKRMFDDRRHSNASASRTYGEAPW